MDKLVANYIWTVKSFWPSFAIWWYRSASTLAQEMACCLMAPSHYLNQYWLIIKWVWINGSYKSADYLIKKHNQIEDNKTICITYGIYCRNTCDISCCLSFSRNHDQPPTSVSGCFEELTGYCFYRSDKMKPYKGTDGAVKSSTLPDKCLPHQTGIQYIP